MSSDALSRPPSTAAATALAPGFRFHPTDDELVSYYLKRRVVGRPLRVDAISEVDLYKVEPWDLPSMSRIQSRDMEWYFFSPLDKKYATRSRTSRTTGKGYWKTTGKDRSVKHGNRVAGMKKTLVFHVGKAPSGDRTNWVMHEYRLTDEELAKAGISQDSYVVCRIFQKNGAGPQNGAQYGAPFVEEEWEDDGKWLFPNGEDTEAPVFEFGDQPCMQIENSDQVIQGVHIQEENKTPLSGSENVCNFVLDDDVQSHIGLSAPENEQFIDGSNLLSGMQNDQDLYDTVVVEDNVLLGNLPSQVPGDDYLELNDFAYPLDADYLSCQDLVVCDDTYVSKDSNLLQLEEFDHKDAKKYSGDSLGPSDGDNFLHVELNDFFNPTASSYFPADDVMDYFDAPNQIPAAEQDAIFTCMNEPEAPDFVDELLAFFDATEDDLASSYLDNPVAVEENQDNISGFQTCGMVPNLNGGEGQLPYSENTLADKLLGISPSESPLANNPSGTESNESSTSDVHSGNGWHKSFTNHFVNMLGSISSPPAFAEPPPSRYAKSLDLYQTQTSTSIRFTAGVVQLNSFSDGLSRKPFSIQKEDPSVLLSYSSSRDDVLDCPVTFDSVSKLNCELGCCLIRSGFCLSFVSVLFLAASFGVYIFTR